MALRLAEREAQTKRVFIWSATPAGAEADLDADVDANPLDAPRTPSSSLAVRVTGSGPLGIRQFEGVVTEVLSGDTFMVLEDRCKSKSRRKSNGKGSFDEDDTDDEDNHGTADAADSGEVRVTLSSIR